MRPRDFLKWFLLSFSCFYSGVAFVCRDGYSSAYLDAKNSIVAVGLQKEGTVIHDKLIRCFTTFKIWKCDAPCPKNATSFLRVTLSNIRELDELSKLPYDKVGWIRFDSMEKANVTTFMCTGEICHVPEGVKENQLLINQGTYEQYLQMEKQLRQVMDRLYPTQSSVLANQLRNFKSIPHPVIKTTTSSKTKPASSPTAKSSTTANATTAKTSTTGSRKSPMHPVTNSPRAVINTTTITTPASTSMAMSSTTIASTTTNTAITTTTGATTSSKHPPQIIYIMKEPISMVGNVDTCHCGTTVITINTTDLTLSTVSRRVSCVDGKDYFSRKAYDRLCYVTFEYSQCDDYLLLCNGSKQEYLSAYYNRLQPDMLKHFEANREISGYASIVKEVGLFNITLSCEGTECRASWAQSLHNVDYPDNFVLYEQAVSFLADVEDELHEMPEDEDSDPPPNYECYCGYGLYKIDKQYRNTKLVESRGCVIGKDDKTFSPQWSRCFVTFEVGPCKENCTKDYPFIATVLFNKRTSFENLDEYKDLDVGFVSSIVNKMSLSFTLTCRDNFCFPKQDIMSTPLLKRSYSQSISFIRGELAMCLNLLIPVVDQNKPVAVTTTTTTTEKPTTNSPRAVKNTMTTPTSTPMAMSSITISSTTTTAIITTSSATTPSDTPEKIVFVYKKAEEDPTPSSSWCYCGTTVIAINSQQKNLSTVSRMVKCIDGEDYFSHEPYYASCYVTFEYRKCDDYLLLCNGVIQDYLFAYYNRLRPDMLANFGANRDIIGYASIVRDDLFNITLSCDDDCEENWDVTEVHITSMSAMYKQAIRNLESVKAALRDKPEYEVSVITPTYDCHCGYGLYKIDGRYQNTKLVESRGCVIGKDDKTFSPQWSRCFVTFEVGPCKENCTKDYPFIAKVFFNKRSSFENLDEYKDLDVGIVNSIVNKRNLSFTLTCRDNFCFPNQDIVTTPLLKRSYSQSISRIRRDLASCLKLLIPVVDQNKPVAVITTTTKEEVTTSLRESCYCGTTVIDINNEQRSLSTVSQMDPCQEGVDYFSPQPYNGKCYVTIEYKGCKDYHCSFKQEYLSVHYNRLRSDVLKYFDENPDVRAYPEILSANKFKITLWCKGHRCRPNLNKSRPRFHYSFRDKSMFRLYLKAIGSLDEVEEILKQHLPEAKEKEVLLPRKKASSTENCFCGTNVIAINNKQKNLSTVFRTVSCQEGKDYFSAEPYNGSCYVTFEYRKCDDYLLPCNGGKQEYLFAYYNRLRPDILANFDAKPNISGYAEILSDKRFNITLSCVGTKCRASWNLTKGEVHTTMYDMYEEAILNLESVKAALQKMPEKQDSNAPPNYECYCGYGLYKIDRLYQNTKLVESRGCGKDDKIFSHQWSRCFVTFEVGPCKENCTKGYAYVAQVSFNNRSSFENLDDYKDLDVGIVNSIVNKRNLSFTLTCRDNFCFPKQDIMSTPLLKRSYSQPISFIREELASCLNLLIPVVDQNKPVAVTTTTTTTEKPTTVIETTQRTEDEASPPDEQSQHLSPELIAGICVGVLLVLAGVAGAVSVFCCLLKRRKRLRSRKSSKTSKNSQQSKTIRPKGKRKRRESKQKPTNKRNKQPKPRQMECYPMDQINKDHFRFIGPLRMDSHFRGEMRHELDGVKSHSLKDIEFDEALNEVVDIGSDIEIIEPSQQTTLTTTAEDSTAVAGTLADPTFQANLQALRLAEEEAQKRKEARRRAKEEDRRRAKEEDRRRAKEEDRRRDKEEGRRRAKEGDRRRSKEEDRRRAKEEDRRRDKEEDRRRSKEEDRRRSKEDDRSGAAARAKSQKSAKKENRSDDAARAKSQKSAKKNDRSAARNAPVAKEKSSAPPAASAEKERKHSQAKESHR